MKDSKAVVATKRESVVLVVATATQREGFVIKKSGSDPSKQPDFAECGTELLSTQMVEQY